jgi:hypothetical protein
LIPLLKEKTGEARELAANALARMVEDAAESIEVASAAPDPDIRARAAELLEQVGRSVAGGKDGPGRSP